MAYTPPERPDTSMEQAYENLEKELRKATKETLAEFELTGSAEKTKLGEFSAEVSEDLMQNHFMSKLKEVKKLFSESNAKTWAEFVKTPQYEDFKRISTEIETEKNIFISRLNALKEGKGRIDQSDLARFGGEIERIMKTLDNQDADLKKALAWAAKVPSETGKSVEDDKTALANYEILGTRIREGNSDQKEAAHMIVAMLPQRRRQEFATNFIAGKTPEEKKSLLESLNAAGAIGHLEMEQIMQDEKIAFTPADLERYNKNWNDLALRTEVARAFERDPYGVRSEAMEMLSLKGLGKGVLYAWLATVILMNVVNGLPQKLSMEEIGKSLKGYLTNPYVLASGAGISAMRFYGNGDQTLLEALESGDRKQKIERQKGAEYLAKMPESLRHFVAEEGGAKLFSEYVASLRKKKDVTDLKKEDFSMADFEMFLQEKATQDSAGYQTLSDKYNVAKRNFTEADLISCFEAFDAWGIVAPPKADPAYAELVKYAKNHY